MKKNIVMFFAALFMLVPGTTALQTTAGPDAVSEGQLLKSMLEIAALSSSADKSVQEAIQQAWQSEKAAAKDSEIAAKRKKLKEGLAEERTQLASTLSLFLAAEKSARAIIGTGANPSAGPFQRQTSGNYQKTKAQENFDTVARRLRDFQAQFTALVKLDREAGGGCLPVGVLQEMEKQLARINGEATSLHRTIQDRLQNRTGTPAPVQTREFSVTIAGHQLLFKLENGHMVISNSFSPVNIAVKNERISGPDLIAALKKAGLNEASIRKSYDDIAERLKQKFGITVTT
jgi:hypothetical protein